MSVAVTKNTAEGGLGETVKIIIQALLLALVVRTFLFQPFNIPSGSMKDTLLIGDYLFVSKFAYGYSRFSLPFSPPLFDGPPFRPAADARRHRRVQAAERQLDRLHQAADRAARRPHPGQAQRPLHQRPGRAAQRGRRLHRSRRRRDLTPVPGDAAQRRLIRGARPRPRQLRGQHRGLRGAGRPLLHDGRQPRQLVRQPVSATSGPGVGYVPFENLVGPAKVIFFSVDHRRKRLCGLGFLLSVWGAGLGPSLRAGGPRAPHARAGGGRGWGGEGGTFFYRARPEKRGPFEHDRGNWKSRPRAAVLARPSRSSSRR